MSKSQCFCHTDTLAAIIIACSYKGSTKSVMCSGRAVCARVIRKVLYVFEFAVQVCRSTGVS